MYCNKCGATNPDNAKFCSSCGSCFTGGATPAAKSNNNGLIIALAVIVLFTVFYKKNIASQSEPAEQQTPVVQNEPVIQAETQPQIVVMTEPKATSAPAPSETQNPYAGYIPSAWADKKRNLGDGGTCGIMEMDSTVRNCNAVDLTLAAEGNRGSSTDGEWCIDFRVGGNWKRITTVYYSGSGGEETFRIRFKNPTTFDAISCYPVRRGNYSYSSLYYLSNADCN